MFRDRLKKIQDAAFMALTVQIGVIINLVVMNLLFDFGWQIWSFGKYLLAINLVIATLYAWAWTMVIYFDAQVEMSNMTRKEIEEKREAKYKAKEQKKQEKIKAKEEQKKAYKGVKEKAFDNINDSRESE